MTGRRARLALLAVTFMVAGCGQSGSGNGPDLSRLPLVSGIRIVAQARQCDRGANAFCAVEIVILGPHFRSSTALLRAEHRLLKQRGWFGTGGDTSDEKAADSPGHKLRVTYATAYGDLKGIDLGWIKRSRRITLTLSDALFERYSALSLMLEGGSA